MNSGKSTALIQVAHNYEERGMRVLLVKPKIDSKGSDKIVSRLGAERKVDILADRDINLSHTILQWHKDVEKVACILVDEAQFLEPEHIDQLFSLTVYQNIPVIAYGLRTDFRAAVFPASVRLFALAQSIEELKTVCRCGKKAIFNGRKIDGRFVFAGSQVAIDGTSDVSYESLCGLCYYNELQNITS